jgi:glucokinase
VWAKAIDEGDELAIELVDRAISYLGAGIGSAVNLLDPEAVVIGGGLGVRFGPAYLDRIKDAMMPHVFADERPPDVLVASLGDLGGATGAALLRPARPRPARRSAGDAARARARR